MGLWLLCLQGQPFDEWAISPASFHMLVLPGMYIKAFPYMIYFNKFPWYILSISMIHFNQFLLLDHCFPILPPLNGWLVWVGLSCVVPATVSQGPIHPAHHLTVNKTWITKMASLLFLMLTLDLGRDPAPSAVCSSSKRLTECLALVAMFRENKS